tara:strand:+ start:364 stop:495 length:132 start_codon:yes stop_codon:yes gene_type:complete
MIMDMNEEPHIEQLTSFKVEKVQEGLPLESSPDSVKHLISPEK